MTNIENKKIVIIGGGPGGLTLARLLQMQGADVKVYERDAHKDAREKGATLDLHEESGLLALKNAGLIDAFNANYRPGADMVRITDKTAAIIYDDAANPRSDGNRPEIDRGPLQQILLDSLEPDTVLWDSHFIAMQPEGDGWKIMFKNGTRAVADLVIAADGANSKIRGHLTTATPFYTGVTAMEGSVYDSAIACPGMHKLLNGGKIFALDDSKSIIVSSKGDGSLVFYATCKTGENDGELNTLDLTDKAGVKAWFKKEFDGWNDAYDELFDAAKTPFTRRPIYSMPVEQPWEPQPNLTMLGDAAHLMPPFAGEGVNMAMLDALELSQCLMNDEFKSTEAALAAYEIRMRKRASEATEQSLQSTDILHAPGALAFFVDLLSGKPE